MTPRLWRELGYLSLLSAIVFFVLALHYYTGGTDYGIGTHFTWSHNLISDLGQTVAPNGVAQPLVRLLFIISFLSTGLLLISTVHYQTGQTAPTKRDWISRDLVILMAISFLMVAIVPDDVHRNLHRIFLGSSVVLASLLWPLAFCEENFANMASRVFTYGTTIILWAYLIFLAVAPRPNTSEYYASLHGQLEKIVLLIVFTNIYILLSAKPSLKKA